MSFRREARRKRRMERKSLNLNVGWWLALLSASDLRSWHVQIYTLCLTTHSLNLDPLGQHPTNDLLPVELGESKPQHSGRIRE
jgi:hypothetical protein